MDNKLIADLTLLQMGGAGRLKAMIGASKFSYGKEGELQFHFKGCRKSNFVKIRLNSMDLYDVTFYKFSPKKMEVNEVVTMDGLYNDMLRKNFEEYTGLYLTL